MTTIRAFAREHPLLGYYALAFAISWGGMLLVIGGPGAIPGTAEQTTELFPAVYLVTVAGPGVAGIVLAGLTGGRTGLRELGSRLLRWRVGARWYAVAILTAPLSTVAALLALSLVSPEFVPGFFTASVGASLPRFGVLVVLGLCTGLLEELGWTGFAVPTQLGLRHGVLATGLSVGLLWGAWHFLSNVWASGASSGVPLVLFMPAVLFSFLPPYRVLMVWVYDRTGSLLVAILMHASLVAFWLISMPPSIAGLSLVIWYLAWAAALWMVVVAVTVVRGGDLWRRPSHDAAPVPGRPAGEASRRPADESLRRHPWGPCGRRIGPLRGVARSHPSGYSQRGKGVSATFVLTAVQESTRASPVGDLHRNVQFRARKVASPENRVYERMIRR